MLAELASISRVLDPVAEQPMLVKDMRGHGLIRRFCMPVKPTKANGRVTRNTWRNDPTGWEDFKRYGAQDVVAERELKRRLLKHDQGQFEWDAWALDLAINERGVRVDMQLVESAIKISEVYRERLMTEARKLTGLSNPNSVKQLQAWFQEAMDEEHDELDPWAHPEEYFKILKLDKKTLPKILENTEDATIRRVVRLRQELGRTSVAKYKAIKRAVCVDGRVHGMIQFYGANRTGRAAGRIVQMQNLRSNKLKDLALAREIVRQGHGDLIELFWGDVPDGAWFYFVHSFYARPSDARHSAGETDYGQRFSCAIARDNIFATQFHPEKSAEHGLALYRNFLHWKPGDHTPPCGKDAVPLPAQL